MAQEITEQGQQVIYGGPQVTLINSTLGNAISALLTREGSGSARAWKQFISGRADFLNTKKILYPGDSVIVYPKTLPMDFPIPVGGGNSAPISWPPFSDTGSGPSTEIDGLIDASQSYTPTFAFSSGAGTLQMQLNGNGLWVAAGTVAAGNTAQFRILNTAPFTGVLTLTPQ